MSVATILPLAVQGAIELMKLGSEVLETWKNNPENQAELDARWEKMLANRNSAIAAWEASKQANNQ